MNPAMWSNPAVRANIERIRALGFEVVEPGVGRLACGETGPGRLADLDEIMARVADLRATAGSLSGRRILVTAGPTREPLDAVRFISNPSSGKTGAQSPELRLTSIFAMPPYSSCAVPVIS